MFAGCKCRCRCQCKINRRSSLKQPADIEARLKFCMVAFSLCLAGLVNAEGRDLVGDAAGSDIVQRRMLVETGPPPSVAAYVDLSLPLVNAAGYNTHPDAVALSAATDAIGPSGIGFKGYVVLKGTVRSSPSGTTSVTQRRRTKSSRARNLGRQR